ncbi:MAG: restriction endonuclease subunit S [Senegalia sp. (in: firmicutes)]|uniref:restriction endonuclease subunit S n=1 Tax=Senegalia sp. (in: firmicutes) TaxID=1924098 RepID=UPI003F9B4C85
MSKWREVKLGEIVELSQGLAINKQSKHLQTEDSSQLPLLRIADMKENKIIRYISKKVNKRFIAQPDDIIYTRTGQVGLVFREQYGVVHNNCFKVHPNVKVINRDFLYWILKGKYMYDYVNILASGAAQPDLTHSKFKNIKITIPDLKTQEKIADVLSAYDELIENNNRRIEILEKTAEEIYKEWFVRMRFPGYKDTKFEKGIPEGWEVKRVGDLGRVETGKTPSTKKDSYYGGNIMFVKTPDMHNNLFTLNTEIYLSKEGSDSQVKKLLPKNSIMVSCIGTGGVVSINGELAHTNQQINSIILRDLKLREWAYFTLKSMKEIIELFGSTGATMTNLSKGKFKNLKILHPTYELIERFNVVSKEIFEETKHLNLQNQNLIKQRDLLLPRLMNGTIEVK